jgi:hypothetical protein
MCCKQRGEDKILHDFSEETWQIETWVTYKRGICAKTNKYNNYLFNVLIMYGSSYMFRHGELTTRHVTRYNTPIHYILSTAPQLKISQKALGTLPEDGNVMPKYVGATIHN